MKIIFVYKVQKFHLVVIFEELNSHNKLIN